MPVSPQSFKSPAAFPDEMPIGAVVCCAGGGGGGGIPLPAFFLGRRGESGWAGEGNGGRLLCRAELLQERAGAGGAAPRGQPGRGAGAAVSAGERRRGPGPAPGASWRDGGPRCHSLSFLSQVPGGCSVPRGGSGNSFILFPLHTTIKKPTSGFSGQRVLLTFWVFSVFFGFFSPNSFLPPKSSCPQASPVQGGTPVVSPGATEEGEGKESREK